jgi:REP element-mobilizing transposase RayT
LTVERAESYLEKRRRRYNEAHQPRELTLSCYSRIPFFSRARTCEWFIEALEKARARFGFQLWAYALMPDHVHLPVNPGDRAAEMFSIPAGSEVRWYTACED